VPGKGPEKGTWKGKSERRKSGKPGKSGKTKCVRRRFRFRVVHSNPEKRLLTIFYTGIIGG